MRDAKTMSAAFARYETLRWLMIPVVAAHNFEEWLTIPTFQAAAVAQRFGAPFHAPSWQAMQLGLLLVTLAPAGIVVWASVGKQRWWKDAAVCWVGGVFLANVFLPHIPAAFLAGGYSPGVLTAVLVNLPFFPTLFRQAVRQGALTSTQIWIAAALGAISLPLCIIGALSLSNALLGLADS